MVEMSRTEKIDYTKKLINDSTYALLLEAAARKLVFVARTSGGTAGRDNQLCAACYDVETLLRSEP